jgi:TonB family protein
MRDFKGCAMFVAALLIGSLNAVHLGQQFDPRERIEEPHRVHLSERVMRSLLKNQAVPDYPNDARRKGIRGTVVLFLAVDEKGRVPSAKVASGDPFLATSAVEAAKRLRFRPYYLNGEAVEIDGRISYLFKYFPNDGGTVSLAPIR